MNNSQLKVLVKMIFGSQLYGTATSDSDTDYKGVFLPSKEQILLNRIPKSMTFNTKKNSTEKNTAEDVDSEFYSLHYFVKLASEGETVALDMLHTPPFAIVQTSRIWENLVDNRHMFYTKNLKAFVGYARKQAAKYSIKGSRLNDAKEFLQLLYLIKDDTTTLANIKQVLKSKNLEHVRYIEEALPMWEVCGKRFQITSKVSYVAPIIQKFIDNYGARAVLAAKNEGIDWKAVSHALRAAYQVEELLTNNTITFPLKMAKYLREVKEGKHQYLEVANNLEMMMDKIEWLSEKSNLPLKVDSKFWDSFLIHCIDNEWK